MSKFKARAIVNISIEAATVEEAAAKIRKLQSVVQLIGVLPASEPWPTEEAAEEKPFSRPPRNTPPSGSPGTPTPGKEPVNTLAVAA